MLFVTNQYATSANLKERIDLYGRFSVNPTPWFEWVFDMLLALPPDAHILEVGCGTSTLWARNLARLPAGWRITLTDASAGMLETARQSLAGHPAFSFSHQSAQSLTFEEQTFDVVIANHVLYHVPSVADVVRELHRVLRPGGQLYASTVGELNLRALWALVEQVVPGSVTRAVEVVAKFTLENGAAQLEPYFEAVTLFTYEDALRLTEAAPVAAYISSTQIAWPAGDAAQEQAFAERLQTLLNDGPFSAPKCQGMFLAVKRDA